MNQKIVALSFKNKPAKHYHRTKTYHIVSHRYPQLIQQLLLDLLQVDGYTDVEIGFASGVSLDIIRNILRGDTRAISKEIFFDIFGLYARVFCNWFRYRRDE